MPPRDRRVNLEGVVETFIGTTTRQTIDGPLAIADFERPNSCAFTPDGTTTTALAQKSVLC